MLRTNFNQSTINAVWEKGQISPNHNSNVWRKDTCSAWIKKSDYGEIDSDHGWEIDHIIPVARGGTDHLSNLQPLHWKNNRGVCQIKCVNGIFQHITVPRTESDPQRGSQTDSMPVSKLV